MNEAEISAVAVIDDDPRQAETIGELVLDAGYEPQIVEGQFDEVEDLVAEVQRVAQAAVCDHRLSQGQMAQFPGAQAVAMLYQRGLPAILVTQYADIDADVTIRRWRPWIPVVLSRHEAAEDSSRILEGIRFAHRELRGHRAPERRKQRSLLHIVHSDLEGGEEVLDVLVLAWRPLTAVRLPRSAVPQELSKDCRPGGYLIASVNTEAQHSEDLFFDDFEPAPDPVDLDEVRD